MKFNFSKYLFSLFLGIALFSCVSNTHITSVEKSVIPLTEKFPSEEKYFDSIISPYKMAIDKEMNEILIYSETPLIKGQPESLLGNFTSDLILKKANEYYHSSDNKKIDICLLNNGGLRNSLPQGNITVEKVFELMPFENEIVILTLSGEKTLALFNFLASVDGMPVAGIKMGIKEKKATNILINNIPFDINSQYKVITSDYLGGGGDKMNFFREPLKNEPLKKKLRDVIIEYMREENQKGNKLDIKKDGRIYYEQ